ncbi:hypothetical protein FNV43_RR16443 [Rhamnella rubrinervis]|uniref:DUF1771 domain-containing protein n=1 Tax=Rhamnella rubrinervis TaxID=2594499 RepID=A0A8K0GYS7_9ROSA|nr:hypothetical protein FNV43_RR16443 [Rhamnella rubrinervis]
MDAVTSQTAGYDTETRDLERLLVVFGSVFSLEDISSAYCEAKRDVDLASEILCASDSASCSSKNMFEGANAISSGDLSSKPESTTVMRLRLSSDSVLQKPCDGEGSTIASKSKVTSVSIGTVSSVIGKEYIRPKSSMNESKDVTKPLKLDSNEFPISQTWNEGVQSSMTENNSKMHVDVEEFLFRMLGEGFQLDKDVIRQVLGVCGYDVQKSMEKLFSLSASTLAKRDDVVGIAAEKSTGKCPEKYPSQSDGATNKLRNLIEKPKTEKNRLDLQKEVLESLFHVRERSEEAPKRIVPVRKVRSRAFGKLVVAPLRDSSPEHKNVFVLPQEVTRNEDEVDDNSFESLRKAMKEYRITMGEYYKAAFDAFAKDDYVLADKFLEQGHFFNKKAREADEKSAQMLLETRDDEMSLDVHLHEPKEALRLLKLHLTSLSGIIDLKLLKVIVGTNVEDTRTEARKRLITKLLEKESIKWTEEDNGQIILIQLDIIDRERLSFFKKKE